MLDKLQLHEVLGIEKPGVQAMIQKAVDKGGIHRLDNGMSIHIFNQGTEVAEPQIHVFQGAMPPLVYTLEEAGVSIRRDLIKRVIALS